MLTSDKKGMKRKIRSLLDLQVAGDNVFEDTTYKEGTLVNYISKVKRFLIWMEAEDMNDIEMLTYSVLTDFAMELREDGIKGIDSYISAVHTFAMEQEWITYHTYQYRKLFRQVKNFSFKIKRKG